MTDPTQGEDSTKADAPAHGRRRLVVLLVAVLLVVLLGVFVARGVEYWWKYGLAGRELMVSSQSPDAAWRVDVYYMDPGAAGRAWVLIEASPAQGGKTYELGRLHGGDLEYATWADQDALTVRWSSSTRVTVGGFPFDIPAQ